MRIDFGLLVLVLRMQGLPSKRAMEVSGSLYVILGSHASPSTLYWRRSRDRVGELHLLHHSTVVVIMLSTLAGVLARIDVHFGLIL